MLVLVLSGALFAISLTPTVAAEQGWVESMIGRPLIPTECTGDPSPDVNDCGLNEVLQVIVNVSKLIVAFAGSAALLVFTYGGVMWIIAAGSPEKIEQGKTAMVSAVIGIVIILSAWLIVNFTILAVTKGTIGETGQIFDRDWFSPPSSKKSTSGSTAPQSPVGAPGDQGLAP